MTGAPILQQSTSGIRVAVEVAWGANLTDLTGSSWTWTDITTDVLMGTDPGAAGNLTITIGRPDESATTQASVFTCVLDNRASNYSQGGQSPNWPYVVRNTPVRVRVSTNSGTTWTVKYQGGAVSWQPTWDEAGRFATVTLTASGPLRRLNQGTLVSASPLTLGLATDSRLVAYWPCEEAASASAASPLVTTTSGAGKFTFYPVGSGGVVSALGTFGGYSSAVTSKPVLTVPKGATLTGSFSNAVTLSGQFQVSMLLGKTSGAANTISGNETGLLSLDNFTGTVGGISLFYGPNANAISFSQSAGSVIQNITGFDTDNHDSLVIVQMTQSGSNIAYAIQTVQLDSGLAQTFTGTITGKTIGNLASNFAVSFNNFPNLGAAGGFSCGHVAIWKQVSASAILTDALGKAFVGNRGESPSARITRLANANTVAATVLTDTVTETSTNSTDLMGCQTVDSLTNNLREAEATGLGVLYDGLNIGLTYVTRLLRESQQPLLTLDASAGDLAVQFAPIDDDQLAINDVTVTRRNGGNYTYQDATGPSGVNAIGDYQTSISVNPADDSSLDNYAQWLVHQGTLQGYRYPTISFALDRIPSRIAAWLTCFPSCRFDVTNITGLRSQMPSDTIRNVLEGWTEVIDAFSWRVTANCTNWNAWNVGTMAASTGTTVDTVMRRDTDGSAVNTAASAGATSVSVKLTASGKPLWTTASDDFPMVVSMGGVPVTVTAISGATSPQTFTVPAGIPIALVVGDPVQLWNPPVLGM